MARILIIEDEDKLRRALRRGLEEAGYDVVVAEDAESGLARAAGEPFDCLILDLMLPGRDGLQVLNVLRTSGCTTPVLILSCAGRSMIGSAGSIVAPTTISPSHSRGRSCWPGFGSASAGGRSRAGIRSVWVIWNSIASIGA